MTNQQVVFTMKFDPADLNNLATQIGAIFGRSRAANPTTPGTPNAPTGAGGNAGAGSFWAIFKPLAFLEFIKKGIDIITKNSTVANTYLGTMGKMFGAAMDLLLIPFLPIFNLLLVGMAKLIEFLSRDDVQKFLTKIMDFISKSMGDFLSEVKNIGKLLEDVWNFIQHPGKQQFDQLKQQAAKTAGQAYHNPVYDVAGAVITYLTTGAGLTLFGKALTTLGFGGAGTAVQGLGTGMLGAAATVASKLAAPAAVAYTLYTTPGVKNDLSKEFNFLKNGNIGKALEGLFLSPNRHPGAYGINPSQTNVPPPGSDKQGFPYHTINITINAAKTDADGIAKEVTNQLNKLGKKIGLG